MFFGARVLLFANYLHLTGRVIIRHRRLTRHRRAQQIQQQTTYAGRETPKENTSLKNHFWTIYHTECNDNLAHTNIVESKCSHIVRSK